MTRPAQHGGGEAGPPIAGDPTSFPSDAELARTLISANRSASLSTITPDGFPYGSLVSYAADGEGRPVVLISDMAEHTVNARQDKRASLLITDTRSEGDPLGQARLTLVGVLEELHEPGPLRDDYLERHPYAAYYADFTDFAFWRLVVERARFVGGFGHMSWIDNPAYKGASVDPLAERAVAILEHMNDDHRDANVLYASVLAGLDQVEDATMTGVDRYGVTLKVDTTHGPRMARVPFRRSIQHADEAQAAVIELLEHARATA